MLIVQRRVGERIVMSNGVEITVAAVTKRGVRLAMHVPNGIVVLRGEVHDAITAANVAASSTSFETSVSEPTLHVKRKVIMQLSGTRFGQIEVDDTKVITLNTGLIGFPGETRFVLLKPSEGQSVSWLQSLSTPELAFPVVDGGSIAGGYATNSVKDVAQQATINTKDMSVLVIVAPRPGESKLVANLLAPIVVDAQSRQGTQVVLDSKRYSAATPIAAVA
jgi:flagellar assembly factor FliW